jgi:hypothetical protein
VIPEVSTSSPVDSPLDRDPCGEVRQAIEPVLERIGSAIGQVVVNDQLGHIRS